MPTACTNTTFSELVLHVRGDISTPLPLHQRGVLELLDAYDGDLNGKGSVRA